MRDGRITKGPPVTTVEGKPPREGVCPECWGWTFHRDMCSQNDGQRRIESLPCRRCDQPSKLLLAADDIASVPVCEHCATVLLATPGWRQHA
jgi:hypothetical protein